MRVSPEQRAVIRNAVLSRDPDARIVLFGSRADDSARGGDIDLLVLSETLSFRDEWPIRRDILDAIGWQKLDLVVRKEAEATDGISRVALETGVPL